jgi:hypothetical protein
MTRHRPACILRMQSRRVDAPYFRLALASGLWNLFLPDPSTAPG